MTRTLKISADPMTLYSFFTEAAPDGMHVERPPSEGATKALNLNVDLTINIDVAKISAEAAALWILARIRSGSRRAVDARIDRKELPPNEADAVKIITNTITTEKKQEDIDD